MRDQKKEEQDDSAALAAVDNDTTVVLTPQLPHAEIHQRARDAACFVVWRATDVLLSVGHEKMIYAAVEETLKAAAPAWQPIETAPKDRRWLLGWHYDVGHFIFRDGPGLITGEDPVPTHWMPLPAPPVVGCVEGATQGQAASLPSEAPK